MRLSSILLILFSGKLLSQSDSNKIINSWVTCETFDNLETIDKLTFTKGYSANCKNQNCSYVIFEFNSLDKGSLNITTHNGCKGSLTSSEEVTTFKYGLVNQTLRIKESDKAMYKFEEVLSDNSLTISKI